MVLTTVTIKKENADAIRRIAKKEKRSVSSQIDYIIEKYIKANSSTP